MQLYGTGAAALLREVVATASRTAGAQGDTLPSCKFVLLREVVATALRTAGAQGDMFPSCKFASFTFQG